EVVPHKSEVRAEFLKAVGLRLEVPVWNNNPEERGRRALQLGQQISVDAQLDQSGPAGLFGKLRLNRFVPPIAKLTLARNPEQNICPTSPWRVLKSSLNENVHTVTHRP